MLKSHRGISRDSKGRQLAALCHCWGSSGPAGRKVGVCGARIVPKEQAEISTVSFRMSSHLDVY